MLLNKPFGEATKYVIKVLDYITVHSLDFNPNVPLIYPQSLQVSPDIYPQKPPDRSQLYRYLNPPEENPWIGGVPIGKIVTQTENELNKLIIKQFKHRLSSEIYNPPLHLTFKWKDHGGPEGSFAEALAKQKEFNDKHHCWRNQYRVRYCELSDLYFLQVRVNHVFPYAVFECDIQDSFEIFQHNWYLASIPNIDEWEDKMIRYEIVQKDFINGKGKKIISMTKFLVPDGQRSYDDNNVLNNRRNNLVRPTKRRY